MENLFIFCRIKFDYTTWVFSGLKADWSSFASTWFQLRTVHYINVLASFFPSHLYFFFIPQPYLHLGIQYAVWGQSQFPSSEGRKLIPCHTRVFSILLFAFTFSLLKCWGFFVSLFLLLHFSGFLFCTKGNLVSTNWNLYLESIFYQFGFFS